MTRWLNRKACCSNLNTQVWFLKPTQGASKESTPQNCPLTFIYLLRHMPNPLLYTIGTKTGIITCLGLERVHCPSREPNFHSKPPD